MAPAASYEHGRAEAILASLFRPIAIERELEIGMTFNLGKLGNFRVPDMGVHRGHPSGAWLPTAAIVVEVRSPDDETYDKFDFYFENGVEEVLGWSTSLATMCAGSGGASTAAWRRYRAVYSA